MLSAQGLNPYQKRADSWELIDLGSAAHAVCHNHLCTALKRQKNRNLLGMIELIFT